jgi:signal transduction histidine kinase/ActR/RegA family two-component response regulator
MLLRPGDTFAAKIFLVIVSLILVMSVAFTGFFVHNQWKSQKDILVRQGEVLAKLLAYNARLGVFAESPELLQDPVDGVLQNNDVLQVAIFSLGGKLLKVQRRKGSEQPEKDFSMDGKELRGIFSRLRTNRNALYVRAGSDTLESWAPVMSGSGNSSEEALFFSDTLLQAGERTIGFVRVVLDKRSLDVSLRKLLFKSSLIAVFFLSVAVVIVFFVVKGVTKPLDRLTERVRMMGGGSPLEKVPVETEDEIGKLASAFNSIAESLHTRESEKEHLEQQLRQAHKMEAIGTLAGGVAHDFNNILSTIEGYAGLLRDRIRKKSPIRDYVEQIVAAAERASELTRRLLAFSRNQVIHPKPVNLNETISSINSLLVRLVGENIEFYISLTREDLIVMADELQIEQMLINLVTNARDAMPHGGTLSIVTELAELTEVAEESPWKLPRGSYAKLMVSDTGVGIDASVMDRIFEPFFTTKEVGKGTGLGLSMAYGIVKQHRGSIEVESGQGKRTVFTIYLPVVDSIVERKKLETLLLPSGSNETILLAEDDRFVRMLTKHILIKYGYLVIEASDGDDALEKFRQNFESVQLLLLDVIMPKKTGMQIYEEARKIRPDIKVLFMSGHTFDVITKQGVFAEDIPLISKPLTPGELLVKIREVLHGSSPDLVPGETVTSGQSVEDKNINE